ncbi:MAG: glycosyltransferase family 9 protein, partial [Syntrophothermus sp.]
MKILIFALSGIGDAIMFTPSIKILRKIYPDAVIDALCMFGGVRDIYSRNKDLDNVLYYNFMKEGAAKSLSYLLKLRGKYDASINVYPANRKEYNIFSIITGARRRAAVKYLRQPYTNLSFLNNVTITEDDSLHNVEENLNLCRKLSGQDFDDKPGLQLDFNNDDLQAAEKFIREENITEDELVIGFHPGCATLKNHIKRRWEPGKFAELGRKLVNQLNARILVFGGPEEAELKSEVVTGIGTGRA